MPPTPPVLEGRVALSARLAATIRTIPDYPKPGILFRDVTTLFGDAAAFRLAVEALASPFVRGSEAGVAPTIAGIEARGLIVGAALAYALSARFVPLRKKGKLPYKTVRTTYQLEYGEDELEVHEDAVVAGERVLLVDDLIATGGTAAAGITLLRSLGAEIVGASFLIDLPDLGGADRLRELGVPVDALVAFSGH